MARSSAIAAIAAVLTAFAAGETAAADLLLVERPGALVILDRYQQTMPATVQRQLTPFAPMVVRNTATHLGDGITPCMTVEIDGQPCYLLLEENGDLVGRARAGHVAIIRGALLAADTVEVVTAIQMSSADRSGGRRLTPGDRLAVLFVASGEAYVRRPGGGFGWVPTAGSPWRSLRTGSALPAAARHRELEIIRSSLEGANAAFVSLFSRLGLDVSYPAGAPRWELEDRTEAIRCVLTGLKPGGESRFAESTEMLGRELQTLLLGRGMSVSTHPGVITIRYLNGAQETH